MNQRAEQNAVGAPIDLVSVLIPAYNVAAYIKETLDSVFAQTYPHYQIVVINDGSPDTPALEEVLAPYLERITYIKQQNRGLSGARNTGIRAAKGNLVALLDGDDIWMPEYLEEQVKYLREHPEYDLVYCNARFFGDSIYDGMEYMKLCPSDGEATSAAIISRRCHVFVSVMARKEALAAIGFDEGLRSCEDFDCWIRFTAAGHRIGYQRGILVLYRKHKASLSANPTWMAEHNIKVLSKSLSLWPPEAEEARLLREARDIKTAELESTRGKVALQKGEIDSSVLHLRAANAFYRSAKMTAVIAVLSHAPWLAISAFKLRTRLFRAYRDEL